jgi:hypothetical protein
MASVYNMNFRKRRMAPAIMVVLFIIISGISCKVEYSFNGASISPQVKTISIQYFQNRASLVQPGLSQGLTDALIDKCKAQTKLSFINGVNSTGDVSFEGEISDYNTRPLTVGADAKAAMNRFTISVKVKFTNVIEPQYSYDKTFSRYQDYDSNRNLSDVEGTLVELIVEQLIEDIFNAAFVNW